MSNQEIEETINKILIEQNLFKCLAVRDVNHKPHPYVIGPKHIVYASDHFSGMLSEMCIKEGEAAGKCKCAHPGCKLSYDEHSCDRVAFLQLQRDGNDEEAKVLLQKIVTELDKNLIDGFTFVESTEQYCII